MCYLQCGSTRENLQTRCIVHVSEACRGGFDRSLAWETVKWAWATMVPKSDI